MEIEEGWFVIRVVCINSMDETEVFMRTYMIKDKAELLSCIERFKETLEIIHAVKKVLSVTHRREKMV